MSEMTPERKKAEEIAAKHFDACDADEKLNLDEARQLRAALADAIETALIEQRETVSAEFLGAAIARVLTP
jgi:hypothetical protein